MLETLTRGFQAGRDRFRGVTRLTEENVAEALADVRMSLLEADVDLKVVRAFLARVQERCVGEEVKLRSGRSRDAVHVTPPTVHRMTALEDSDIFEVSTPETDDVVRLEDRYGRQGT